MKRIGTVDYIYLVRSRWDKEKKTPRQEIIKYLGVAANLNVDDIPKEYRDEPKVREFLSSRDTSVIQRRQENLHAALVGNDLDGALSVYEDALASSITVESFFDLIFKPVLYNIGKMWADGQIDITTEHVASNVANALIRIVRDRTGSRRGKISVLLCTPYSEKHRMGCDVLETYLAGQGFVVYNLGADTPTSEVIKFVDRTSPDAVAISSSGEYSMADAYKMADKIADLNKSSIILGGYAFRNGHAHSSKYTVCAQTPLKEIPRIIRQKVEVQIS